MGCRYDSSRFPDGATLTFKVVGRASDGQLFTDWDRYIVYNKYSAKACADFENYQAVISSIGSLQASINHVQAGSGTSYTKQSFLSDVKKASIIQYSLHGSTSALGDTLTNLNVSAPDIAGAIAQRSWRPQLNMAFASTCWTCAANTIPDAFACTGQNQAYVGFDALALIVGLQLAGVEYWTSIRDGKYDVGQGARVPLANTAGDAAISAQRIYDQNQGAYPANVVVKGDSAATAWGLYLRTSTSQWIVSITQ